MSTWTPRQVAMLAEMGIVVQAGRGSATAFADSVASSAVAEIATPATVPIAVPAVPRPSPETDGVVPSANGLDWHALRDAAAACTACGLCEGRTRSVFGTGRRGAHWLVVGEPPDDADDAAGAAFAAEPGALLDNMLRAIGVTRIEDDVAADQRASSDAASASTTTVVKCRPPAGRPVTAAEVGTCRTHLMRQIELLRPRVVLAMGRWSAHSLLASDEPLGRLRGRVHRVAGLSVVVTYDPAYLLRNPQDKSKAWADLCLAAETAASA